MSAMSLIFTKSRSEENWLGLLTVRCDGIDSYCPSILMVKYRQSHGFLPAFSAIRETKGQIGRLEKPETGIRNRNGNGNRKRNRNRNRKRQRNRDSNVKGNRYKNRDIITLYYFNSDSIDTKKKKTSLLSCSPLTLFILRQREGKKSSK